MTIAATRAADPRLLLCLEGLATHHGRGYCWPSQDWIVRTLRERYGRAMCRRTLNRHLRALEDAGLLWRRRRSSRDSTRGHVMRSTLYRITDKARAMLAGAVRTARTWAPAARKRATSAHVTPMSQYPKPIKDHPPRPPENGGRAAEDQPIGHSPAAAAAREWINSFLKRTA